MKTCTKCGNDKAVGEFYNDKNRKDGKYPQCKECVLEIRERERDTKTDGRSRVFRDRQARAKKLFKQGLKQCARCERTLPVDGFHDAKGRGDGKFSRCMECARTDKRLDYLKHRHERRAKAKRYQEENSDKIKEYQRLHYRKNKQQYIQKRDEWRRLNPERCLENRKKWYERNRESLNARQRNRYKTDPDIRAQKTMRAVLYKFLTRSGGVKSTRAHEALGYSHQEFKAHIEKQFQRGMHWGNYGRDGWVIDHIIPVAQYIRNGETDPAVVNCLTNLRPMWAKDNISKSDKITHLL